MMPTELPQGRYLSLAFRVATDAGGQTRALLMRNRILLEGGVHPDVLTLGPVPDHAERREILLEQGLLADGIGLLNIYDHFRDNGWGAEQPTGATLANLSPHLAREETGPGGLPWRTIYRLPGRKRPVLDYLRADGTPYLRMPAITLSRKAGWSGPIQQVGAGGEVVGEFRSPGQWFRRWIRDLAAGHERAFVFADSRFVVPHVVPMRGGRIHLIYQMHNLHVGPPRRWNSPTSRPYKRVLNRIDGMDAMVTLTERQRDDIAERRGRTSNMFVVPNPVALPAPAPEPVPRDPNQVTMLARLATQKRLTHAIAAFKQVIEAVPAARLDIYGQGKERANLQAEIERRRLSGSVTLRGFDPRAGDALWTSSAFLMTSVYEGYPLSTIESMSRGCPVVSYDIKYGPREQISDGVDGFLVPDGDVDRAAGRVIELLRSPELVKRMSAAARSKAQQYGPTESLDKWAGVVRATIDQKPYRTRIEDVSLELTRLRARSPRRLVRGPDRALELAGVLKVDGYSRKSGLDAVALELAWIEDSSGDVTELRLEVRLARQELRLRAKVGLPSGDARLRLRLTWRNSSWQTDVARVAGGELRCPG